MSNLDAISTTHRRKPGLLTERLRAGRRAVGRLQHVEGRLSRIAAPYAARVVARIVDLHAAGQSQYSHYRALLQRLGIRLHRTSASPLQGAARALFAKAPWGTISTYACAAGWVWDRVRRGLIQLEEIEAVVVREGGVALLAKRYRRERQSGRLSPNSSKAVYRTALDRLARAGFVVGDSKRLPPHDAVAVIRKDAKGRREVRILDMNESRVREFVIRLTRRDRRTQKAAKSA